MRVLQVLAAPFPAPLGSQLYAARLCAALAHLGHDVVLAAYAGGDGGSAPVGVRVVRAGAAPGAGFVGSGPHWSRGLQDLALWRVLRRLGRSWRPDVVHAHNIEAPLVARAARLGAPVLYGQHTSMTDELPAWFPLPGMRHVGRMVDAVVPRITHASAALSQHGAGVLPAGSAVIPPGVVLSELAGGDPDRARRRWSLGTGHWVVYAGNADPYQDLERWLVAMRSVPKAGVLLVTGGEVAAWRRRATALGLADDRVRMIGGASFADMRDALAAATLAVVPRARCAGFPMKLLNQLGVGVVTVCAPGSARDIAGVIAARDDSPGAFAAALRDILADDARRARLSRAAVEDVTRRFTWEARAAEVERLYATMVRAHGSRTAGYGAAPEA